MVVMGFTGSNVHRVWKNLLTNCESLPVNRNAGIRYGTTQLSKMMDATCSAVVYDNRIARVSFVYWSAMKTMNWFSVVVLLLNAQNVNCDEL